MRWALWWAGLGCRGGGRKAAVSIARMVQRCHEVSGGPDADPSRLIPCRLGWTRRWSSASQRQRGRWPAALMLVAAAIERVLASADRPEAAPASSRTGHRRELAARHRSGSFAHGCQVPWTLACPGSPWVVASAAIVATPVAAYRRPL